MAEHPSEGLFLPSRRSWVAVLAAGLLACACSGPPDDSPEHRIEERLVGTWLRDYEEAGTRVRRVLVLDAAGHFEEMVTVSQPGAAAVKFAHAGEWLFDGTNLKRPTVPFATFELRFESPKEFVGVDNVHKRQVRYRRVAEGTLP
jgi:hypothetical protein